MTKITLMAASAAVILGLSGCTDAEMAQVEEASREAANDNVNMVQMEIDCKNYIMEKNTYIPKAAISVRPGYGSNYNYTIPVSINWDEPRIEETGNCKIVNGIVRSYTAN